MLCNRILRFYIFLSLWPGPMLYVCSACIVYSCLPTSTVYTNLLQRILYTIWIVFDETVHFPFRQFRLENFHYAEETTTTTTMAMATTLRWQNQHQTNMVVCTARETATAMCYVIRNCLIVFKVTNSIRFCCGVLFFFFYFFGALIRYFLIRHTKKKTKASLCACQEITLVIHINRFE